jgi:hypothetical protein
MTEEDRRQKVLNIKSKGKYSQRKQRLRWIHKKRSCGKTYR